MTTFRKLFAAAPVEAFAKSLAGDIAKRYPATLDQQPEKRPSVNRLTRIIEDACTKAIDFQKTHALGWFGKAKLGNAFRWELAELGYTKEFVDFATEAVIVNLSKGKVG